jgi:hypothetical protein
MTQDITVATLATTGPMADLQALVAKVLAEPSSITIVSPGLQEYVNRIGPDLEVIDAIIIDSPEMLAEAQQMAGRLSGVSVAIEKERLERTKPLRDLASRINDGYNAAGTFINTKVDGTKTKILGYNKEVQRKAAEQAEIERKAHEEAVAAAALVEAAAQTEALNLAQQAQEARQAGSVVAANDLMERAAVASDTALHQAQKVVSYSSGGGHAAPKTKGVRGKYVAECTNAPKLIAHVAVLIEKGDLSLVGVLSVDQSALNKLADLQRENFKVPGCHAEFKESVSIRKVAA